MNKQYSILPLLFFVFCLILFSAPTMAKNGEAEDNKGLSTSSDKTQTPEPTEPSLESKTSEENNSEQTESPVLSEEEILFLNTKGNPSLDKGSEAALKKLLSSKYMPIDLLINGQYLKLATDALYFRDYLFVPLRSFFQMLPDSQITWNPEALRVDIDFTLKEQAKKLSFFVNSRVYFEDGKAFELPISSFNKNGHMMLPFAFFAKYFGFKAQFDSVYRSYTISELPFTPVANSLETRFYSPEELKIFSRLVYKEAGSVGYQAMHGVASVVLNHIRHPYYADNLTDVIFAKSPSGYAHFAPAYKAGFAAVVPSYDSVLAVKKTLRGENSIANCLYFNTRPFRNKKIFTKINGIYFCY